MIADVVKRDGFGLSLAVAEKQAVNVELRVR
jgi:hypothetical protein